MHKFQVAIRNQKKKKKNMYKKVSGSYLLFLEIMVREMMQFKKNNTSKRNKRFLGFFSLTRLIFKNSF